MAKPNPLIGPSADSRPRIHIFPQPDGGFSWSIGATGWRDRARTAGQAIDTALGHIDKLKGAVIILEPM
jgi:hypothetical protein